MNIEALIEELKKYPSDTIVSLDGYEGGIEDFLVIKHEDCILNFHEESYYGPHEQISKLILDEPSDLIPYKIEKRLIISRYK